MSPAREWLARQREHERFRIAVRELSAVNTEEEEVTVDSSAAEWLEGQPFSEKLFRYDRWFVSIDQLAPELEAMVERVANAARRETIVLYNSGAPLKPIWAAARLAAFQREEGT